MSNPVDAALYHSLSRLHRAYDGLLDVRSVAMPKPSKMPLTVEMGEHLGPALKDVYWHPLRNGLAQAPENPEDLRDWKLVSMRTLEGGKEAFGERGKIYGHS